MHTSLPGLFPVAFLTLIKERPLWLLFVLGACMIVPVGLASALTLPLAAAMSTQSGQLFLIAFVGSSLPEELLRFAVLYYVGLRWIGFERPRDGLIFGIFVSLGFSCAENVFYAVSVGWATGALKLAIATPIHLALGVTMGGMLAFAARAATHRKAYTLAAFAIPVLVHGVYDLVLLKALTSGGTDLFDRLSMPVLCYALVVVIAVLTALRTPRGAPGPAAAA